MMLSSIQPAISNFIIDQNCEQTLCRPAFEAGNYERGKKSTLAVFFAHPVELPCRRSGQPRDVTGYN